MGAGRGLDRPGLDVFRVPLNTLREHLVQIST